MVSVFQTYIIKVKFILNQDDKLYINCYNVEKVEAYRRYDLFVQNT